MGIVPRLAKSHQKSCLIGFQRQESVIPRFGESSAEGTESARKRFKTGLKSNVKPAKHITPKGTWKLDSWAHEDRDGLTGRDNASEAFVIRKNKR